jgi:glycosyltransferase involved in cell wall biosynthesis
MVHVLHVAQPVDGGVGRVVADVAVAERRLGLDVTVAAPDGWLAEQLDRGGVRCVRWDAVRDVGAAVAGELRRFAQVVDAVRPDVVHLHSSKAGLVGRLALRGRRPTLFSPHGWAWQAVSGALVRTTATWERFALRWTAALVCVSDDELSAGRARGVATPDAVVVRNGVDLAAFAPVPDRDQRRLRADLALPPDAPVALCVGRLNDQKGQDVLVRGWPRVVADLPTARLVLLGEGPLRAELEATATRLGVADSVSFVPPTDAVASWYRAADVVVLSSRYGVAMPLTPLEAMACGRPVVATDVAGVREALGPDCGAIVAADDLSALAAAVAERLGDDELRRREGHAARDWAQRHFDLAEVARRLTELTESVAAGSRRSR